MLFFKLLFERNYLVFSFQANIYCILICKLLKVKVIVRSNSSPAGWSKNFLKSKIYKFFFSIADKIIVNSIDFQKEFKKKFKINVSCIFNPLNKNEIIKRSRGINIKFFNKSTLNLINVGRLVDQKNQITILKALNLIKNKLNFRMLFIGKGELKQFMLKYINENNLEKNIKIIDYKKNPFPYIKQSDIFILSSKFEGLPNVLLEAIVLKKFVISTNCPTGPREILLDGKGGELFKINDYKKLSRLLINFNKKTKFVRKKIDLSFKNLDRYDYKKNLIKYYFLIKEYL